MNEWAVLENRALTADLLKAAMKVCDRHGDCDAAREDMRNQCMALSPELQRDLLAHFQGQHKTFTEEKVQ